MGRRGAWWRYAALGAALAGLLSGAGCEGDGGSGGAPAGDAASDARAGGGGADVAADDDAPGVSPDVSLAGTWARREVQAALTNLPVVGETTTRTTALSLLTIEQDGTELTMALTVCSLVIDNGTDVVQTVVPDALVASLPVRPLTARLAPEDGAVRYVEPTHVEVRGARLADPAEALPTSAADPRVWDQDGDGHPGVTLRITGLVDGEVYVVQRRSSSAEGTVRSADEVRALVEWDDEQVILDTDNPLLAAERTSRPAPPEESSMRLRRIEEGATCADVLARADALFGGGG